MYSKFCLPMQRGVSPVGGVCSNGKRPVRRIHIQISTPEQVPTSADSTLNHPRRRF
jgi:hypothetical protein